MTEIGITERGDAALDKSWIEWVANGKPAILITKDPEKLWQILLAERMLGFRNLIIHCTITGFGGSKLEPNAPPMLQSILAYIQLVTNFGAQRVVLRIDPIIANEYGFQVAMNVFTVAMHELKLRPHGNSTLSNPRVRISFLDMYPHVAERFAKAGIPIPHTTMHAPIQDRLAYLSRLSKAIDSENATLEVCGEPGIICTGCVSEKDGEILSIAVDTSVSHTQRKECPCIAAKHELLSSKHQCRHRCVYCYWRN